ncbi:hypothetical protein D3871_13590 [Noviherbaspirillum saxi]|uniref:Uncharacterized protein n=1 Tax=Noviherbaspirillum saxi TaxID=2320863 RepID=A0A3A3FV25_9BURK|nr:hypothetical protein D3871_13590 [Noviherbaspirillum saxi]
MEGVPAGTEAYADRKFLMVSVTVFLIFKNRKSFIHAGLRRLFHSTYPCSRKPTRQIVKILKLFHCFHTPANTMRAQCVSPWPNA